MPRHRRDPDKERFWRTTLRQWQQSQLSVRAFCQRHQLAESAFYFWKRTLHQRDRAPASPPAPAPFVPVRLVGPAAGPSPSPAAVEVVLRNGRLLRIGPNVEPALLRALLPLLEDTP